MDSFALEMLKELKAHGKRWFIIAVIFAVISTIEFVLLMVSNLAWLSYESQFEEVTQEQMITQEQIDTENSNMSGVIN